MMMILTCVFTLTSVLAATDGACTELGTVYGDAMMLMGR